MADIEKQNVHHHGAAGPNDGVAREPATFGGGPARQAAFQGGVTNLRKFANPAPLGLLSFASTTLILSLVNVQATHVNTPNVVVGMALFVGGLCQLLAGMWEFAVGNTFGATAFSSYGGFWLSYATILIPGSGVLAAYTGDTASQEAPALGFFLATWFIFTFLMFVASLRSNVVLISLFFCLTMTFMFLTIGQFVTNVHIVKAGGGFGIVTAFIAYYGGITHMLTPDAAFFTPPLGHINKRTE